MINLNYFYAHRSKNNYGAGRIIYFTFFKKWAVRGSNLRPPRCRRGALNQLS